ncbi:MAG: type II secretion system protein [Pseudomonadota bacterium]
MRRQAGFTMIELVTVMVLIGAIAAIGIPRLMGSNTTATMVFGDQVVSALRHAQKTAVARRRLVCVTLEGKAVRLRMREDFGLPGAGVPCTLSTGATDTEYGSTNDSVIAGAGSFAGQASIALFFHPDGTVSKDAAGTSFVTRGDSIGIKDGNSVARTIVVEGSTGHVQ